MLVVSHGETSRPTVLEHLGGALDIVVVVVVIALLLMIMLLLFLSVLSVLLLSFSRPPLLSLSSLFQDPENGVFVDLTPLSTSEYK